ncbi:efflux transporter outer membrane subunit [Paraburkholderia terricola]|jgi:NodT family efflux transporter outer membrane factor (OMF) lipoprotein|uniref:Efflux transporter, outer membrane factor (OMF) lipoprotein, NodT family n=2 Tax=Paraburkholderia TaxID=1822464 RepID=A0A1M6S6G3_9BURK|nr:MULTISPECIES: efflux transporter outer membrane subunit [Paraburkholderia]ORC46531.1 secretion protein [Burkholderia sp. A27]SDO57757.1 efflux transporter, outer membrane factor (OMF) lipoprotein, NodT family [Paraburkholderia sediminicola]SHK40249.1 efflux transporter, outer membrane factor (OMF) lipoprotein, NodT family [Paraburkholderia terricola]
MTASEFSIRTPALAALLCFALVGCAVGPDFERPQTTTPAVFDRTQSAQASSKAIESEFSAQWWMLFNDPILDSLEKQLSDANLDVAAASARLRQSRAGQRIAGAEEYPRLSSAASYNRERGSPNGILSLLGVSPAGSQPQSASGSAPAGVAALPGPSGSPAYDLYQAGVDASWELDIWGRARRGVEAATALTDASYEDRNAILLSARAELARDYVQLRDAQALLQIARQNLVIARDATRLTQTRVREGVTTDLDVANASAQAELIESLIPTLESRSETTINAIGVLLAEEPGALRETLGEPHDVPALPEQVPIGIRSELVQRRPDIRRAEAQLHAATAAIGMAKADFYPRISLNGSAGFQSLQLSNLASWASGQFVVGPSITLPIFEGGRLKGTLHLREAQQQEAAIVYRRTVLQAWREVDDALVVYDAEQRRRDRLKAVVGLNQRALSIARQRYKAGAVDFLDVLNVQKQLLDAQSNLEQSKAHAAANLIALCKALGGGWESTYARSP